MSATAAAAASFGNPDEPPQGAINAKNPTSVSDPGPQDPAIRDQLPSAFSPPATDVGSMPSKSSPFVTETKGGTLQVVDSRTFNVSKTIAVALQTIRPGAMRQMHWHPNADEWQYYIKGKARWISIPAISVTPRVTTDTMCRTSATPTCNSSRSSGLPSLKSSRWRTGLHIPRPTWWRST
jgi:Cupin